MSKTMVITGASRGIGLASVELFAKAGYRVINLSRNPTNPEWAQQIYTDMSHPEWIEEIRETLLDAVGDSQQISLIHNAALLLKDNIQQVDDFAKVMQVNLMAVQQLNEVLLPEMKAGSSILYIGSTLSHKAVANTLSYASSKHAILGLMRATCQDLFNTGIHTACVCPGFTDTEMLRNHIGEDEEVIKLLGSGNAFGRLVQPAEIARCLMFCAENPVINGSTLDANLGQLEN